MAEKTTIKDKFDRKWIIEHALEILQEYEGQITLRQLYYRLVAIGMTNDLNHYKRVIGAMTLARWNGNVDFDVFIDREREMAMYTAVDETNLDNEIEKGKTQIEAWISSYHLNRWENQENYIEVWIEKKALQGVFEEPCKENAVGLAPCKGYPSLTFLDDAKDRFVDAQDRGQEITILYFGDYDPSGEDIPRSIKENISRMDCDITIEHIALNQEQIKRFKLPSAPVKLSDTRSRNWTGGGVVELDALEPKTLERLCDNVIKGYFDEDKFNELIEREEKERVEYRKQLRRFVNKIKE